MKRSFLFLIVTIIIPALASAQLELGGSVFPYSDPQGKLTSAFENYKIYTIDIAKADFVSPEGRLNFRLVLGGKTYLLELHDNKLVKDLKGQDLPLTFGGRLYGGGEAALTVNDDFIYGVLTLGQNEIFIEPLVYFDPNAPRDAFVVYNSHDVKDVSVTCGVNTYKQKSKHFQSKSATIACRVVDLAIANDYGMFQKYGSTTSVTNHNVGVINNVNVDYRSEFDYNVEFNIVTHFIPQSAAADPFTTSNNANTLLNDFITWATNGNFGVSYDMGELWTSRDLLGTTIGIAQTPGWHHVLEDFSSSAALLRVLTSHEMGHNFSAAHDGSGGPFIMSPFVAVTSEWSTASVNAINNRLSTQTQLADCSTFGAPNAAMTGPFAACVNSTVEFKDISQYGVSRTWDFFNGSPTTSTDEKPTVSWSATGLNAIFINSTNSAGTDADTSYIDIETEPTINCSPSGTGGTGGITSFALENIVNGSGDAAAAGKYENFLCSHVANLAPNTNYDFAISIGNCNPGCDPCETVRIYIDYNADGDFDDPGEEAYSAGGNLYCGTWNFSFTTAVSPVMETILRMRVISDNQFVNSPCHNPSSGQVEDYGVYFPAAQTFGCTDPNSGNYDPSATVDDGSCSCTTTTYYADNDGDQFGDPNNSLDACTQPNGYVLDNTDCDDMDANNYPGNTEVCDGQDNDCDGLVDTNDPDLADATTYFQDNDGDGFGNFLVQVTACSAPNGYVDNGADCNDNDANNYPGNDEVCDGQDNDCDGLIDALDPSLVDGTVYYQDVDGDGFGNPNVSLVDCSQPVGFVANGTDCDDQDPDNYPGNAEVCDGQDNDCDGLVDANDPGLVGGTTYYQDNDGDGFGNASQSVVDCSPPNGYVTDNTDCNDNDSDIYPGNTELCDGKDNDCDILIDEGCPNNCDYGTLNVSDPIASGVYNDAEFIVSSGTINDGPVTFSAKYTVTMQQGFEVKQNQTFTANIVDCPAVAPQSEDPER